MTPKKAPTDYNFISKPATCLSHRSSGAIPMLILFWEKLSGSANATIKVCSKPSSFPLNRSSGQIKKPKPAQTNNKKEKIPQIIHYSKWQTTNTLHMTNNQFIT